MTPNKLPPLPEQYREVTVVTAEGDKTYLAAHNYYTVDQMHAYAAEALRQSQSLPAGAVAGLVGKWRGLADVAAVQSVKPDEFDEACRERFSGKAEAYRYCADTLEQALQADARQKGEAVAWAIELSDGSIGALGWCDMRMYESAQNVGKLADGARYVFAYRDATQPAQASEKECTLGVGDGSGQLFVHGSYDAIKACQALIEQSVASGLIHAGNVMAATAFNLAQDTGLGEADRRTMEQCRQRWDERLIAYRATHPQPVTPAGGEVTTVIAEMEAACPGNIGPDADYSVDASTVWAWAQALKATNPPVADAALVRDAERWRYVRDNADITLDEAVWFLTDSGVRINVSCFGRHEAERAIDAALNQRGGG